MKTIYDFIKQEKNSNKIKCRFCFSDNIIKCGLRINKYHTKQLYKCRNCGKRFTENNGFLKRKFSPEIITVSLDLWTKGLSINKIRDHIFQFYNIEVACSTILNWLREYGSAMKEYTDNLDYDLSGSWAVDESAVRFNGNQNWLWNLMNQGNKFLISSRFTVQRWNKYSDQILSEGKSKTSQAPDNIQTDGFRAYDGSIKRVFGNEMKHIRHANLKSKPNMNIIERVNGTCKDRLKPTRGFRNVYTANQLWPLWIIYYNFIKEHHGLNMNTPAESCGIKLNLNKNKWLSLINKSFENNNIK